MGAIKCMYDDGRPSASQEHGYLPICQEHKVKAEEGGHEAQKAAWDYWAMSKALIQKDVKL